MEETVKKPWYIIRKRKQRKGDRKTKTKGKRKDKERSIHKSQYWGMSKDTFSTDICV